MIIPLWVKALVFGGLVVGAMLAWNHVRDGIWHEGYAARTAEYDAAVAVATRDVEKAEDVRTAAGESIADTTRAEAQQAVAAEQQTTTASAETVRTIIRRIEVPGNCPTTLPPEVEAEGHAAVARANGARR